MALLALINAGAAFGAEVFCWRSISWGSGPGNTAHVLTEPPIRAGEEGADHIREATKMVTSTFVNLQARSYIRANVATREHVSTTHLARE